MAKKIADNDLTLRPTKIYSFTEFEQYYGQPLNVEFIVSAPRTRRTSI
jgi:hypothetical protein